MKKLVYLFFALVLASCATTKPQPEVKIIERVKVDTINQIKIQKDSIFVWDSVAYIERNDTIYLNRWHNQIKYIERYDTLRVIKTDSIPVVTYVDKPVKYIPAWRKITSNLFFILIALIGGYIYIKLKR